MITNVTNPGTGLDGLKGFALQDVMIDLNTTGTNMNGSVFIPNPSVITIAMVCQIPLINLLCPLQSEDRR